MPEKALKLYGLKDKGTCTILLRAKRFRHADRYTLTSGGEFRLSNVIADNLRSLAASKNAPTEIVFQVIPDVNGVADQLARDVERSLSLTAAERLARLSVAPRKPRKVPALTMVFLRNADVIAHVLQRANGVCEECGKGAPFLRASDGSPHLEVHHRVRLADDGEDTIANAVALCPTCHRRLHFGLISS